MSRQLRVFGLLFLGMLAALALGVITLGSAGSTATAAPLSQTCDTTGTVDGSADPTIVLPGHAITFTVWNMTAGENVSFWFTMPNGNVFGTPNPFCCAASNGYVNFPPLEFTDLAYQNEGRWALTVEGATSHHQSIVYFCLYRTLQATATAVPPTATSVPPTATGVPPSATSVPATETAAPPTATGLPASPTVVETPVATTQPTLVPTTAPTIAPAPTEIPTAVPTEVPVVVLPTETSVAVGMPRTGGSDGSMVPLLVLGLMALSLLAVGLMARRGVANSRK